LVIHPLQEELKINGGFTGPTGREAMEMESCIAFKAYQSIYAKQRHVASTGMPHHCMKFCPRFNWYSISAREDSFF